MLQELRRLLPVVSPGRGVPHQIHRRVDGQHHLAQVADVEQGILIGAAVEDGLKLLLETLQRHPLGPLFIAVTQVEIDPVAARMVLEFP